VSSVSAEFAKALRNTKICNNETEFPDIFLSLLIRRNQLLSALIVFFRTLAPDEKLGDSLLAIDGIKKLAIPLPKLWLEVIAKSSAPLTYPYPVILDD
jgi:hypothetical protein